MNSLKTVGLIIALVGSMVSVSALAEKKTESVKKQQSKKHSTKKGKKVVKKKVAKSADGVTKKSSGSETAKLSTDINFNDSVLHGRYQTPDEADAKVENEKSLSDLLAVRTQFKDRLKKSSEQN